MCHTMMDKTCLLPPHKTYLLHPTTQEDDTCHDSDNHEGEDSEDMDTVAADPSGEYSQKR